MLMAGDTWIPATRSHAAPRADGHFVSAAGPVTCAVCGQPSVTAS
jgi:hypothetical protein